MIMQHYFNEDIIFPGKKIYAFPKISVGNHIYNSSHKKKYRQKRSKQIKQNRKSENLTCE